MQVQIFKETIEVRGQWFQRSRNGPRSRQDCTIRKDGESAKCCRTMKIPGNDQTPTEVHQKPVRGDYSSSRSPLEQERMAFGPSSRRMFLSPKERNDPSASSRSLMPRKRNYYSADASSNGLGAVLLNVQDDGTKKPIAYASRSMTVWPDRERSTRNHLGVQKVFQICPR